MLARAVKSKQSRKVTRYDTSPQLALHSAYRARASSTHRDSGGGGEHSVVDDIDTHSVERWCSVGRKRLWVGSTTATASLDYER